MKPFENYGVGRIVFGQGAFDRVGELAGGLGKSVLVVHNSDSVVGRLSEKLAAAGMNVEVYRQKGEPVVSDIDAIVSMARRVGCDCLVGMGGGSAMDAAKAVAGVLANSGEVLDYMEVVGQGKKLTQPAMPWMAIPTTAGTGAEATRNAVIGFAERKFKASVRSELLLPRIALIDPCLGVSVPANVTAASGMDALCQLMESYTSTGANPVTDALALKGIGVAAQYLPLAYADGKNLEAREGMALAALLSGMTLTSAGLGAVHGFAAPIGANFPVPHGVVCAALLPRIIRANVRALVGQKDEAGTNALGRYAQIGRQIPGFGNSTDDQAINACTRFTMHLLKELRIPPLRDFGMKPEHVKEMVGLARKASSMRFNPVVLSDEALGGVLLGAIEGGWV